MTLPSTGPLTASEILEEFNDFEPFILSDYYGHGDPALPSSGAIQWSDFLGVQRVINLTIGSQNNYNLYNDLVNNHGWPGNTGVTVNATVVSGATVQVFDIDSFPSGSNLTVINNGIIQGPPGSGGSGGSGGSEIGIANGDDGDDGFSGGTAMQINHNVSIDNSNGTIGGGGGGAGGGGGGGAAEYDNEFSGGADGGDGGSGGNGYQNGGSGSSGGSDSDSGMFGNYDADGGDGGAGGDGGNVGQPGADGQNGQSGDADAPSEGSADAGSGGSGGAGASAGTAIAGSGTVNWIAQGNYFP